MKKYRDCHQHQYQLLPPSLEELIDAKHLVRVVNRFVDGLSPKIWDHLFCGGGAPAYPPPMMLKIILYAYSNQIYTCRRIARFVRPDVTAMWLAGMERPNFNTVNRFRSKYFADILAAVFTELLDFLHQKGYISFSDFFVDGTKIEANAGQYTHVWKKNTERYKAAVVVRVKRLFHDIERLNAEEDAHYGDADLPERGESVELTSQEIKTAAEELSQQLTKLTDKKQHRAVHSRLKKLKAEAIKLANYEQQEQLLAERNSYSKTDPDATFLRLKDDRLRAAYNVQISTEHQFITNYSVSQNASDTASFAEHREKIINRGDDYRPDNYMGDAAYGSEENYNLLAKNNINNYLKYNTFHPPKKKSNTPRLFERDRFSYDETKDSFQCPAGRWLRYQETVHRKTKTGYVTAIRVYKCNDCSACPQKQQGTNAHGNRQLYYNPTLEQYKAQAWENLNSEQGRLLRKRRGAEVETPFGDIKYNRLFRRFYLRGLPKVELEFGFLSIGYNLRKVFQLELKKAA